MIPFEVVLMSFFWVSHCIAYPPIIKKTKTLIYQFTSILTKEKNLSSNIEIAYSIAGKCADPRVRLFRLESCLSPLNAITLWKNCLASLWLVFFLYKMGFNTPHAKINLKWVICLNIRPKTKKHFSEENIGINLHDLGVGNVS